MSIILVYRVGGGKGQTIGQRTTMIMIEDDHDHDDEDDEDNDGW